MFPVINAQTHREKRSIFPIRSLSDWDVSKTAQPSLPRSRVLRYFGLFGEHGMTTIETFLGATFVNTLIFAFLLVFFAGVF